MKKIIIAKKKMNRKFITSYPAYEKKERNMKKEKIQRQKKKKMEEIVYIIPKSTKKIDQINAIEKYRMVRKKAPKAIEKELKILGFDFLPSDLELKHRIDAINSVKIENSYKKIENEIKKQFSNDAYSKIKDFFPKSLKNFNCNRDYKTDYNKLSYRKINNDGKLI